MGMVLGLKQLYNMKHFYQKIDGYSTETDQGKLLKSILLNNNFEKLKIIEIGVFKGRCTAMWNVILTNENINYEYYAVDHFLGSLEHDKTIDYYNICRENLQPILDKINLIKNESVDESKNYPNEFFDVIYIDASHEYESVKLDIISWLPKLKKSGIICGDDYVLGWPGVIKAVNEIFGEENINTIGHQQWWIKI
jgi:predicted O-methyltransferase YrrM